jgi:hypothetical protein
VVVLGCHKVSIISRFLPHVILHIITHFKCSNAILTRPTTTQYIVVLATCFASV